MKTIRLSIALLFVSASLFAQNPSITKLRDFDKLQISNAFRVTFVVSETFGVECSNPALIGEQIRVDGNKLVIKEKPNTPQEIAKKNAESKITVYAPSLEDIGLSGASSLSSKDVLRGDDFDIALSGASNLSLYLEANEVNITMSGASDASLTGKCGDLKVVASGASDGNFFDLKCQKAEVTASGASDVLVSAETLKALASGGSDIKYEKNKLKTINKSTSGGSKIVGK